VPPPPEPQPDSP
jgi:hypothetical protein